MDKRTLSRLASAHVDALVQIDHAIVATQATGLGHVSQSLSEDIAELHAVQDRISARLKQISEAHAVAA